MSTRIFVIVVALFVVAYLIGEVSGNRLLAVGLMLALMAVGFIYLLVKARSLMKGEVELSSPSLVRRGGTWWLHTPIEKRFCTPPKIEEQVTTNKETKLCAV